MTTTLNDFFVIDDVTDNSAAYHNRLVGGVIRAEFANTETISATKELSDADCQYQILTADGANRDVELPPEADTNHLHIIYNAGASNSIPVKDDSGAVTFITLAPDEWAEFIPVKGEAWQVIEGRGTLKAYFDTLYVGLTNSNVSPTTDNVTAAVNTRYFANVSGLTANRNFILSPGTVGDAIELNIKTGDDTYALVIIGDTDTTINGGSVATEWSRLFITGENIRLVADTTSNWQVTVDKRIPCKAVMRRAATQSIGTASATKIAHDTQDADVGDICDIANSKFVIRRAGNYQIISQVYFGNGLGTRWINIIYKGGAQTHSADVNTYNAGCFAVPQCNPQVAYAAADYIEHYCYHNQGGNINVSPSAGAEAFIIIEEKL